MLIILLENEIRRYCQNLHKFGVVPIKLNGLRGSSIEKFMLYTTKLAGFNFSFHDGLLENLKGLIELRNCIVHADSSVDEFSKKR